MECKVHEARTEQLQAKFKDKLRSIQVLVNSNSKTQLSESNVVGQTFGNRSWQPTSKKDDTVV